MDTLEPRFLPKHWNVDAHVFVQLNGDANVPGGENAANKKGGSEKSTTALLPSKKKNVLSK